MEEHKMDKGRLSGQQSLAQEQPAAAEAAQGQPKDQGLSRRQFLFGAGVVGAGAALSAGLTGCEPTAPAGSGSGAGGGATSGGLASSAALNGNRLGANAAVDWQFLKKPADIPAADIKATEDVDVLVIGIGWAGVVAAASAAEQLRQRCCGN